MENTLRPLALNLKNALFIGHFDGTMGWARIGWAIETAEMNGVNPQVSLQARFEAIAGKIRPPISTSCCPGP